MIYDYFCQCFELFKMSFTMMLVAFENAFDKLMEIMEFEGWTDGGKLFIK